MSEGANNNAYRLDDGCLADQKISLECDEDVGNDVALKAASDVDSGAVTTIISHLEGSDAEIITNLLYTHSLFRHEVLKERKRNRDLVAQITTSLPNYTKIKNSLRSSKNICYSKGETRFFCRCSTRRQFLNCSGRMSCCWQRIPTEF